MPHDVAGSEENLEEREDEESEEEEEEQPEDIEISKEDLKKLNMGDYSENQIISSKQIMQNAQKGRKDHHTKDVVPELSCKVGMMGVKLNLSDLQFPWEIVSLKEQKLPQMLRKGVTSLEQLRQYHLVNFTRIYPKGTRTASTNYDPMFSWGLGSQIAALNFQTKDDSLLLNYGKFHENGGKRCGYLLKPASMTDGAGLPTRRGNLKFTLISA